MPTCGTRKNHREQTRKLDEYKTRLINKGVVDGANKMHSLLCKFASKHF